MDGETHTSSDHRSGTIVSTQPRRRTRSRGRRRATQTSRFVSSAGYVRSCRHWRRQRLGCGTAVGAHCGPRVVFIGQQRLPLLTRERYPTPAARLGTFVSMEFRCREAAVSALIAPRAASSDLTVVRTVDWTQTSVRPRTPLKRSESLRAAQRHTSQRELAMSIEHNHTRDSAASTHSTAQGGPLFVPRSRSPHVSATRPLGRTRARTHTLFRGGQGRRRQSTSARAAHSTHHSEPAKTYTARKGSKALCPEGKGRRCQRR